MLVSHCPVPLPCLVTLFDLCANDLPFPVSRDYYPSLFYSGMSLGLVVWGVYLIVA